MIRQIADYIYVMMFCKYTKTGGLFTLPVQNIPLFV